jgi:t-SNARE complex subunit (syntaxin)
MDIKTPSVPLSDMPAIPMPSSAIQMQPVVGGVISLSVKDEVVYEKDPGRMTSEDALHAFEVQRSVYEGIQNNLRDIDGKSETLTKLQDEYDRSADGDDFKRICALADRLTSEVHSFGSASKKMLGDLQLENDHFAQHFHMADASASLQMRQNVYNSMTRRFQQSMNGFRDAHARFNNTVKSRQTRRLKQLDVNNKLDDKTIESIVEKGQVDQLVQDSLMSDDLRDCIAAIEQRHSDVLALERSVHELFELFKDVATLVDIQHDSVQVISEHISKAREYAERGEQHLKAAEKEQKCSRTVRSIRL